jgi:hypothetical protein
MAAAHSGDEGSRERFERKVERACFRAEVRRGRSSGEGGGVLVGVWCWLGEGR